MGCTVMKMCCEFAIVQLTTETTVVDDCMIGGNASADGGADEAAQDVSSSGCNIVLANRLQEQYYDKAGFKESIKVSYEYSWLYYYVYVITPR